ncbi:lipid IV(A) 3-deoxy-D-manno-octulosonic acid transferase [Vibrio casei]|uniref:lipid IV(A) 3-deoxy-D-manno-octulosonic acid transferase n=1 Tax=Vibrio casei TaxID=673372 RepID=UPI003F985B64
MIRYLYTCLLLFVSPIFLFGLYKKKAGKPSIGARWKEHFGVTPKLINNAHRPIWIHTVSVGETIAATPLIKALKQANPDTPIIITTTTTTGAQQAEKLKDIAEHRYMPLDLPFAITRFLKAIQPQSMLIMETELWPNTLYYVAKFGIPITVINARLSERSALRYQKFQSIFNLLANNLSLVLCQHQDDADRFIRLGMAPDKVQITGSLKFDIHVPDTIKEMGSKLRNQFNQQRPVWIAASTHQGEDEQVLIAHQKIVNHHPSALLILVPRHPERFNDVYQLCLSHHFTTVRRTENDSELKNTQVYLADTMGEMMLLLAASDVCFMGGSLMGDKIGGHNLLEPAALGLPCITGPSYYNFTDITNQLTKVNAAFICDNPSDIADKVDEFFSSKTRRNECQQRALSVIKRNQGAVSKTMAAIQQVAD